MNKMSMIGLWLLLLGWSNAGWAQEPQGFRGTLVYALDFQPKGEAQVDGLLPDSLFIRVGEEAILASFTGKAIPMGVQQELLIHLPTGLVQLIRPAEQTVYVLPAIKETDRTTVTDLGSSQKILGISTRLYAEKLPNGDATRSLNLSDSLFVPVEQEARLQTGLPVFQDSSRISFALKVNNKNMHGSQQATLVRIVEEVVPESAFVIPAEYEQKTFEEHQPRLKTLRE